jgi:hypothetical protein
MSNMVLGTHTFIKQPATMTLIQKDREVAKVKTYSSVALFSWGASIIGKTIEISWPFMTTSEYASFQAIYEADAQVVFDPQDGSSKTYNVELLSLTSEYFIHLSNASGHNRRNVKLTLLIMSEV